MGSKAETAAMMSDWLTPNALQVVHTKKELKRKGIKSPNIEKIPYRIKDLKQNATYYATSEEQYIRCFKRLTKDRLTSEFRLSHPELVCKSTTSGTAK